MGQRLPAPIVINTTFQCVRAIQNGAMFTNSFVPAGSTAQNPADAESWSGDGSGKIEVSGTKTNKFVPGHKYQVTFTPIG